MEVSISDRISALEHSTREIIHNNIHYIIEHHYQGITIGRALTKIQEDTGVSGRMIRGWMNDKKLPDLRCEDGVKFCSYYSIPFSFFVSNNLDEGNITPKNNLVSFIPAEIARIKTANLFRMKGINNAAKFDSIFQDTYSLGQYYVHQRKKHTRNISWKFIFTCSCVLDMPISYFFEIDEGNDFL